MCKISVLLEDDTRGNYITKSKYLFTLHTTDGEEGNDLYHYAHRFANALVYGSST